MNTVVRHKQPSWTIISNDEHRCIQGNPGEWATYASIQNVDGLQAYVLRDEASAVMIQDGASLQILSSPSPSSFFSFTRSGTRFGTTTDPESAEEITVTSLSTEWLYSVFGYLLPDYRIFLTVLPSHSEYHCEPRSTPFTLL